MIGLGSSKANAALERAATGTEKDVVAVAEQSNTTATAASAQAGTTQVRQSFGAVSTRLASTRRGGIMLADVNEESGVSSGDDLRRKGMWFKASGSLAQQDKRSGVSGYNSHTYGATLGMDNLVRNNLRLGLALSAAQSKVKSKGADKTKTDVMSYQVAAYGSYEGRYFVEGQLAYALNKNDTARTVLGGDKAKGDFQSHQYSASLGAGVPFGFENGIVLTPKAGLFYSYTQSDTYTETDGGDLNLKVTPEDTQILEASLGATVSYEHTNVDGSTFRPEFRAAALYEFLGDDGTATAKYTKTGATIKTPGMEPAKFAEPPGWVWGTPRSMAPGNSALTMTRRSVRTTSATTGC